MKQRVLRNRFNLLLAEKAYREGKSKISRQDVVSKTGLAKTTIDRIARNEVSMYADHVVVALCDYFDCEPGDLLVIEEVESSGNPTTDA